MSYSFIKFRSTVVKPYYALHETSQKIENEDKNEDRPLDQTPSPKNIDEQLVEKIRSTVKIQILKRGLSQSKSRPIKNMLFIIGKE